MDKIPTLSKSDRFFFWLLHIVIVGIPFILLFSILFYKPSYFLLLLEKGSLQPLGWFLMILILFIFGMLGYLAIRSLKNIEKRPIIKSIMDMVLMMLIEVIIFTVILLLPGLFIFLQIIFH
jgi:hypothetical protein